MQAVILAEINKEVYNKALNNKQMITEEILQGPDANEVYPGLFVGNGKSVLDVNYLKVFSLSLDFIYSCTLEPWYNSCCEHG